MILIIFNFCIQLDQASLGMPDRSYILRGESDPLVKGYMELMIKSAVMLGGNEAKARTELQRAFKFESLLAQMSIPREDRRNYTTMYNKMKIKDIKKMAQHVFKFNSIQFKILISNLKILIILKTDKLA